MRPDPPQEEEAAFPHRKKEAVRPDPPQEEAAFPHREKEAVRPDRPWAEEEGQPCHQASEVIHRPVEAEAYPHQDPEGRKFPCPEGAVTRLHPSQVRLHPEQEVTRSYHPAWVAMRKQKHREWNPCPAKAADQAIPRGNPAEEGRRCQPPTR